MLTLPRAVLRESIAWFIVYCGAYSTLIALALGAPLVRGGAPLDAVAAFLLDQFAFLGVIVLPLALVTAIFGVIGRMRDEGEVTALMAAGISSWAVARALMPLAWVIALFVAYAAHALMPDALRRIFQGQSQLAQQMIATQVARRAPIISNEGTVVAAIGSDRQRLIGVFAVNENGPSRRYCYAPEARWMWLEKEGQLGFDLREPVFVNVDPPKPGKPIEMVTAFVENYWSIRESDWKTIGKGSEKIDLFDVASDIDTRADVLSTPELAHLIGHPEARRSPTVRYLRELQRVLHLRLMMPAAVLAYWAFACGVGLSIGRGNRLLALCVGILVVACTIIVPMTIVKNLRGSLGFDPGFILWPPMIVVGAYGGWLLWRRR